MVDRLKPEVSIIIPCFNRSGLVAEAVQSAIAQGEQYEVIVVDDGSTDDSWDEITAFEPHVRAFRTSNQGVSAARNLGINEAQGRFIKFLDSDDRMPVRTVTTLATVAESFPPDCIVFGDAIVISDSDRGPNHAYGYADAFPPGRLPDWALFARPMPSWLPLFPTRILRAVRGFDTRFSISEDQELSVRLLRYGLRFIRYPFIVAEVREHPGKRLTRNLGASEYDRLLAVQTQIAIDEGWLHPSGSGRSKLEFSQLVWTSGRNAAREGFYKEARQFFALGGRLAGAGPRTPNPLVRFLYRILDPVTVESLLEFIKKGWRAR